MDRITNSDLEKYVDYLNRLTGNPVKTYTRTVIPGAVTSKANIGNYHISGAYGGVELHRINTEGGGVTVPLSTGYCTKRELYNAINSFISGVKVTS